MGCGVGIRHVVRFAHNVRIACDIDLVGGVGDARLQPVGVLHGDEVALAVIGIGLRRLDGKAHIIKESGIGIVVVA